MGIGQREDLLHAFDRVRRRSLAIAAPLSSEDCCAQSMPDASPVKWHLAHTTWFFETFILEAHEPGFAPFHPAFRVLFNSYYNGIGAKHPRPRRGLLTRPSLDEVRAYRQDVDGRVARLLAAGGGPDIAGLVELGLQHEQQHQELMLTDVKHLLAQNPLYPAYSPQEMEAGMAPEPTAWIEYDGGLAEIGYGGSGFCFDNELPRHRTYVAPFDLASRLVTNGEYLEFIHAGGYRDPSLWLAEGWDRVCSGEIVHPLYWLASDDGAWSEFTLHGVQALDPAHSRGKARSCCWSTASRPRTSAAGRRLRPLPDAGRRRRARPGGRRIPTRPRSAGARRASAHRRRPRTATRG